MLSAPSRHVSSRRTLTRSSEVNHRGLPPFVRIVLLGREAHTLGGSHASLALLTAAPLAVLPAATTTGASAAELDDVRLSSTSHWGVPVDVDGSTVRFLVSHPTPPVFDGAEDRNGTRNHDEIRPRTRSTTT